MKKLAIILIAAVAMISCGNVYTGKTVALTNQNDSMNYALGVVNGAQMKMYQLRNDTSIETITEFIDALQRGYDGKAEELSEAGNIGRNIGIVFFSYIGNQLLIQKIIKYFLSCCFCNSPIPRQGSGHC